MRYLCGSDWIIKMIDVPSQHLLSIKQILLKQIPGVEVRAFGSRVSGMAKPYSDLDLVIMGEHKMDAKTLMNLNEDFADSDIPFRVEILDWHDITNEFRRIIKPRSERI
jgi:predicted nucleotidyltransferase